MEKTHGSSLTVWEPDDKNFGYVQNSFSTKLELLVKVLIA